MKSKKGSVSILTLACIIGLSLYVASVCGIGNYESDRQLDADNEFGKVSTENSYTIQTYDEMTEEEKAKFDEF